MSFTDIFSKKQKQPVIPDRYTLDEAVSRICESEQDAKNCGYDVTLLHCHGCIKSCQLDTPRCEFGERVKGALAAANR